MNYVTCNKCSWVYFSVSEAHIQNWEKEWSEYYPKLDEDGRESFGLTDGPPSRNSYLACSLCGNSYKDFHDTTDDEFPNGSTIGPIKNRAE